MEKQKKRGRPKKQTEQSSVKFSAKAKDKFYSIEGYNKAKALGRTDIEYVERKDIK